MLTRGLNYAVVNFFGDLNYCYFEFDFLDAAVVAAVN